MITDIPPGRPGNLTAEQEEKLRRLWGLILHLCGVGEDENVDAAETSGSSIPPIQNQILSKPDNQKPKKKRLSLFARRDKKGNEADSGTATPPTGISASVKEDQDDKYGQTKQFFDALASMSPETLRATLWSMVKHDHPDGLVLRFLRARKWDVDKALVMLISTMNWRATEMHVDDDIMKNGEGGAVAAEKGGDPAAKRLGHDFLAQIRMGKSFLHGADKAGRPICVVRVRLHRQGEQVEESLERYTVYIIETARMLLLPPVDTAVGCQLQTCRARG
jgi:CRAL/TRIO, N-terminal domain/CRAL/TRIO domain